MSVCLRQFMAGEVKLKLIRTRYRFLVLSLIIMLSGVFTASAVQGGFGSVEVTQIDLQASDGALVHATLQRPVYATDSDPLPGVLVIHGSLQNKEWLMAFGIELSQRGFVVLTIDASGHGNSDSGNSTLNGVAALEFLAGQDYVDETSLGLIGHSMGGGISWGVIKASSITVNSLVLVGSGVPTDVTSVPYIPNLLVTVGDFDSLSSYPRDSSLLEPAFNVTNIESDVTYGEFALNSARKFVVAKTNHLFETIDPVIVTESVEWMKDSLKGGVEDSHWIPSETLIYPLWLGGGFIGLLGILLTIFPMLVILIDLPIFSELKQTPSTEPYAETKSYFSLGILYGIIGLGTFFPFLAVGTILHYAIGFPMYQALPVMTWMIGSGLLALVALYFLAGRDIIAGRSPEGTTLKDLFGFEGTRRFLLTLVLASLIIVWLYVWTILVDVVFALDYRCFLPGLNDLTIQRLAFLPIYFIAFFVFFFVEGIWFTRVLRTAPRDSWMKTQIDWSIRSMFIKTLPYLIMIGIEFGGGMLTGIPLIPGMIGYSFLFFYAFTPWFAVATVITMFGYRLTNNHYIGAILNALICAWLLATILSISF